VITSNANLIKKLPKWAYKSAARAWIDKVYPRHLFIETVATCNLSCSYCPREKIKGEMEFGLFQSIVEEASKYGRRSFSLHLFGEPLLYSKWFDAIQFIKKKNNKHTVLLTTNGTLIERGDNLDKLIKSGVDQVLWSWRTEAKFSELTKERLKKWGKFRVRFIKEVTPKEEFAKWKNWKNREERSLHNYGGNVDLLPYGVQNTEKRWPCYHLWLAPAVSWNGDILICCADPHKKEVLGNFQNHTVHEVWTGSKLYEIRQSHLRGEYKGICEKCDVWKAYPSLF